MISGLRVDILNTFMCFVNGFPHFIFTSTFFCWVSRFFVHHAHNLFCFVYFESLFFWPHKWFSGYSFFLRFGSLWCHHLWGRGIIPYAQNWYQICINCSVLCGGGGTFLLEDTIVFTTAKTIWSLHSVNKQINKQLWTFKTWWKWVWSSVKALSQRWTLNVSSSNVTNRECSSPSKTLCRCSDNSVSSSP